MTKEKLAMICHEANRAYCSAIGDNSQPPWESAPQWQKESAIKGVDYHTQNLESRPRDSHESWLSEKMATGWKYGPVKDAEKKEHPCCVPFDELPPEQQAKDFLFTAIVKALHPQLDPPIAATT